MESRAKFRTIIESKRVLRMNMDGISEYLEKLKIDQEKSTGHRREYITMLIDLIENGLDQMLEKSSSQ